MAFKETGQDKIAEGILRASQASSFPHAPVQSRVKLPRNSPSTLLNAPPSRYTAANAAPGRGKGPAFGVNCIPPNSQVEVPTQGTWV